MLPNAVYVYLALQQPTSLMLINAAVALEQFGYGFGFTAYMMYLIRFSEGQYKTSHYALCTGFILWRDELVHNGSGDTARRRAGIFRERPRAQAAAVLCGTGRKRATRQPS